MRVAGYHSCYHSIRGSSVSASSSVEKVLGWTGFYQFQSHYRISSGAVILVEGNARHSQADNDDTLADISDNVDAIEQVVGKVEAEYVERLHAAARLGRFSSTE